MKNEIKIRDLVEALQESLDEDGENIKMLVGTPLGDVPLKNVYWTDEGIIFEPDLNFESMNRKNIILSIK